MPDPVDLKFILNREPEEILSYFRAKGYRFTWDWFEMWQESHARAFTVAKALKLDILQDIRDAVTEAIRAGWTFREFQKNLSPKLREQGWWGKVLAKDVPGFDPESGVDPNKEVQLGSPWRLKTIYRANLQTSMQAGRYKSFIENVDDRPYWMYVAVLDKNTRPSHAALHGKVYPYDDPFWDYFYPPNDWGCRCRVRALTAEQVKQRGIRVESAGAALTLVDKPLGGESGETRPVAQLTVTDRNGRPVTVSPGVGWSYNPGKAAFDPGLGKYDPDIRALYEEAAVSWILRLLRKARNG